ncbi:hypothetical protein H0H92_001974 [Tricholoma furcatifolium]|nr:hypothetical protein H0H92_001974 [Tricholoma furcatifolium]
MAQCLQSATAVSTLAGEEHASEVSVWRKSTISAKQKILKTDVKHLYRIDLDDYPDLTFETKQFRRRSNGYRPTGYLYRERDVERKAWERYGGPDGFEAQPPSKLEAAFPPWVWKKCNDLYDEPARRLGMAEGIPKWRIPALTGARKSLLPYPLRPDSLLPDSPSISALREILAYAPRWDGHSEMKGVDFQYDESRTVSGADWAVGYAFRVYDALSLVIDNHGLGDDGWRSVRWEVYDTVGYSILVADSFDPFAILVLCFD